MATTTNGIATEKDIYDAWGGLFFESSTNRNKCPTKNNIIIEASNTANDLIDINNTDSYKDEQLVIYNDIKFNKRKVKINLNNYAESFGFNTKIYTGTSETVMYEESISMEKSGTKELEFYLEMSKIKNKLNEFIKINVSHNKRDKGITIYISANGKTYTETIGRLNANITKIITTTIYVKDLLIDSSPYINFTFSAN